MNKPSVLLTLPGSARLMLHDALRARTKAPAPSPEVLELLQRELPEVRFEEVSLDDARNVFRDGTGINLFVDTPALNRIVSCSTADVAAVEGGPCR
jgi:hypothetical protein